MGDTWQARDNQTRTAPSKSMLVSHNGQVGLDLDATGDLVLRQNEKPYWDVGAMANGAQWVAFHPDGNLVLWNKNPDGSDHVLWSSGVPGNHPNAYLLLQDDHNLVIYDSQGRGPKGDPVLWAANRGGFHVSTGLGAWVNQVAGSVSKILNSSVGKAVAQQLPPSMQGGFQTATDILANPAGAASIMAQRAGLSGPALQGFDIAASIAAGAASGNQPPPGLSPDQLAGWYATHGMANAPGDNRAAMASTLAQYPGMRAGMGMALDSRESLWHKILRFLHLVR
jgi:hypothetical protein